VSDELYLSFPRSAFYTHRQESLMSQHLPLPPPGFDALSVEEQLDYVQSLWDHIAANPEQVPLPDWHKEIIAERLTAYWNNPDERKSWEDVEADLNEELKRRSG
jgi:putative addiction module component (TIGR02574 family)